MKLSTKLRYTLLALVEIENSELNRPLMVHAIAAKQGLPTKYLENLLITLKKAGIVRSIRGRKGGYELARAADKISVADVAVALDGPISLVECSANPDCCGKVDCCPTYDLWLEASKLLQSHFKKNTIADLAGKAKACGNQTTNMYHI